MSASSRRLSRAHCVAIVACTLLGSAASVMRAAENRPKFIVDVRFSKFQPIEDVAAAARRAKCTIVAVQGSFTIGSVEHVDSMATSENASGRDIERKYRNNRLGYLRDMLNQLIGPSGEVVDSFQYDAEDLNLALDHARTEPIVLSGATLVGSEQDRGLLKALRSLPMQSMKVLSESGIGTEAGEELGLNEESPAFSVAATVYPNTQKRWYPVSSSTIINPASSGGRYVQNDMFWLSNTFGYLETYEQDFYLDNSDGLMYLNGKMSGWPRCIPDVYWTSTWPAAAKPYLDTRLDQNRKCNTPEQAFTLGAAQASAIPAGVWHRNYIRTSNGNSNSDWFKLQAQLGYRDPIDFYGTFSSFSSHVGWLVPFGTKEFPSNSVPSITSSSNYVLKVKHSRKCADESTASNQVGGNIHQWACHGGLNQRWNFFPVRNAPGYFHIVSLGSGLCMDEQTASSANGGNVHQWTCHGRANQQWRPVTVGGGYYKIVARHSGKCLDESTASSQDGGNIHQWDCHGRDNQLWKLEQ